MADTKSVIAEAESRKVDGLTLIAFLAVVILGGSNAVAFRLSCIDILDDSPNPLHI